GDGVQLIRDSVLDSTHGVGTGSLREHFDAIVASGGRFYVSRLSSNARGVTEADLEGKPAQFGAPTDLVRVTLECDRTLTY
ncbi:MAG TPA: DsrE family protein, partial [Actinomycetota bacterium]|nr:DsrE family protein [Actinomycetota bacterium]